MLNILKGVKLAQDDSTGDVYAVDCADGPKKLTGGGGSGSGQFIVVVYSKNPSGTLLGADKTYNEIRAAIESGMRVVIHKKRNIAAADYDVFYLTQNKNQLLGFCNYESPLAPGEPAEVLAKFIDIYEENGETHIEQRKFKLQMVT